jgi:hypothetical protein
MPRDSFEPDYARLREVLAPEYANLPAGEIEALVYRRLGPGLEAQDYEGVFDQILGAAKGVGGAIGNVAGQASPYVGSALQGAASGAAAGSALGPWGMLGGALLGATGGALSKTTGTARDVGGVINKGIGIAGSVTGPGGLSGLLGATPTPSPATAPSPGAAPAPAPVAPGAAAPVGAAAAGQLLNLFAQPQMLQALMAMMLGPLGKQNVQVGNTPVPVGAFSNLAGTLANRASTEAFGLPSESEDVPEYLTTEGGQLRCDVADSGARADALWELLQENYAAELAAESEEEQFENIDEAVSEDELYDDLELADFEMELSEVED